MAKIKVKINAPAPSIETIHQYRDFNRFMDQYKKYYSTSGIRDMLYNDRKKLIFIVIIILFLMLLLFAEDTHGTEADKNNKPLIEKLD